jgi:hypothetical protein
MEIVIDRNEVLRYLGYQNQKIDEATDNLIDDSIREVSEDISERYVYRIFDIETEGGAVKLKNCSVVLPGSNICSHLTGAVKCAVMAVTIGNKIDEKIRYYSRINLTRGLIVDACATAAVESLCDKVEEELKEIAKEKGLFLTSRYSPGYGNLPITLQPDILNILDAHKKIGLSVTESFIMTPRKSVTAIAGFVKEKPEKKPISCTECDKYEDCIYRREGKHCES